MTVFSVRGLHILNGEIALHLPLTAGGHAVFLTRRLPDESFILLHGADVDVTSEVLVSAMVEWPDIHFGRPEIGRVLTAQQGDGILTRSQIRLKDVTLAGLIGDQPPACPLPWEEMARSAPD